MDTRQYILQFLNPHILLGKHVKAILKDERNKGKPLSEVFNAKYVIITSFKDIYTDEIIETDYLLDEIGEVIDELNNNDRFYFFSIPTCNLEPYELLKEDLINGEIQGLSPLDLTAKMDWSFSVIPDNEDPVIKYAKIEVHNYIDDYEIYFKGFVN